MGKSYFLPIFGLFFLFFAYFSPIFWISGFFYSVDGQGFCNPTIQSETWLVHAKVREPHVNPPGSYELSASRPCFKGKSQESSYEPGGSGVVRELSREPAMFQIGL